MPYCMPKRPVQALCDRFAHRRNGGRRAVTVQFHGIHGLMHVNDRLGIILGTRHAGIAQTVVKNIVIPDLLSPFCRVFTQFTDDGFAVQHRLVSFVYHLLHLSFLYFPVKNYEKTAVRSKTAAFFYFIPSNSYPASFTAAASTSSATGALILTTTSHAS